MNQANQKQVIQTANMNLVQIRQYELQYFSTFFSNFGTQAALMIGFIAGSLSQVPGTDNPAGAPYFFVVLYWVTSALTMMTGMHALLVSVFLQVFGQGLALRGPVGSMVRAVEGMVAEQQQIFYSFILTMFFFGLQAIGMYWVMMDSTSSIVCTILTVIAMFYWYQYSLRVYNRFSWKNDRVDWQDEEDPDEELDDLNPNAMQRTANGGNGGNGGSKKNGSPSKNVTFSGSVAGGDKRIVSGNTVNNNNNNNAFSFSKSVSGSQRGDNNDSTETNTLRDIDQFVAESHQLSSGYLTIRNTGTFGRDVWERKYFVIRGTIVYYYKDKRSFDLEPAKPINRRPIDLEGYTMIAGAVEPPYAISLVPIDPQSMEVSLRHDGRVLHVGGHLYSGTETLRVFAGTG
jgi:hypothetical protein